MSKKPSKPAKNPPSDGAGVERKKPAGGYPEGQPSTKPPQQPNLGSPRPKAKPTREGH